LAQLKAAGLNVDTSGNVTNSFVAYDDATKGKVTLAGGTPGTTIANVKAGKADMDAVNLAQLKAAGLNVDTSGNVTNSFVAYDDATKGKVTLAGGTPGTTIANVKAGKADMDAVNLAQLKAAGLNVDTSGNVTNSFVAYDDATKGKVTLAGGTPGTTIANVKAGKADMDAVNLAQLKAAGLNVDTSGNVTNSFVAYDDATKGKVTLAGGTPGTTIANVKAGKADMDAVNLAQLKAAGLNVDTSGNVTNSFVAYDDATKGKVTLAGGTPGTTIANVKAGKADMDAVNLAQLKAAGLNVDTSGNVTNSFVAYDDATKGKVTLAGGTPGTTIANVKAGKADMDAVNLAQLKAAGLNVDTSGNVTNSFVAYDDATKGKVTLAGGTPGTTIANVKAGKADMDAVNLAQLKAAGLNVDTSGNVTNSFVAYDDATKGKVTLAGGTPGTTIANVKAGKADMDAVNLAQLKAAGLNVDTSGNVTNSFVAYDDATKGKVTLAGGTAGTTIANVKAGKADMDAVNLAQLKAAGLNVDTSGAVTNSFVAYDDATKGKVTLAGGTAGTTIANVKAGKADMDAVNLAQLKAAGLNVDTSGNVTNSFVAYDDATKGKVTLAGGTAG